MKIPELELLYPYKRKIKSYEIIPKSFYKLIGESGLGKTTYLNELVTFLISNNSDDIIYIQQSHELIPSTQLSDLFSKYDSSMVFEILHFLKVNKKLESKCSDLSGGEVQRTLICEAILANPKLLILDEPVSAIDEIGIKKVNELLTSYVNKGGIVIYVSHVAISENFNKIQIE